MSCFIKGKYYSDYEFHEFYIDVDSIIMFEPRGEDFFAVVTNDGSDRFVDAKTGETIKRILEVEE
jgi:hypothetical protein